MKSLTTILLILFVLSLPAAPVAGGTEPPPPQHYNSEGAALEDIFEKVKTELGGVPLDGAGFSAIAEDLDLYENKRPDRDKPQRRGKPQHRLSYSGEFKLARTMSEAELKALKDRFAAVIDRLQGIESYEIELDDDSFDLSFEQSRNMITVGADAQAAREHVPYVSVTISLTAEEADKYDDDDAEKPGKPDKPGKPVKPAGAGYTTLEYDIDVYLQQRVVRLQLGQKDARANGKAKRLEVAPFTEDGRTLVQLRFLGEQLGAVFQWDEDDKEVTIIRDAVTIKIRLDDDEAIIHIKGEASRTVPLEVPAKAVRGRIVVPLRFVSENFDADVRWNPGDNTIIVRQ